jgi:hypothetical protein
MPPKRWETSDIEKKLTENPNTTTGLKNQIELSWNKVYTFDYIHKGKQYPISISTLWPARDSEGIESYQVQISWKKYSFDARSYDLSKELWKLLDAEFGKQRKKIPEESEKANTFIHTISIIHANSELIFERSEDNIIGVSLGKSTVTGRFEATSLDRFESDLSTFLKENRMTPLWKNQVASLLKALKVRTSTEFFYPKIQEIWTLGNFNQFMKKYFPVHRGGEGGWHAWKTMSKEVGNELMNRLTKISLLSQVMKQDESEERAEENINVDINTYLKNPPVSFTSVLGFNQLNSENTTKLLPYIKPSHAYMLLDMQAFGSDIALINILKVTLSRKDTWLSTENASPSEFERLKRLSEKVGGYKVSKDGKYLEFK